METPSAQAPPYRIESPDTVRTEPLEPLDYQYRQKRDIEIVIEQPEHTSV